MGSRPATPRPRLLAIFALVVAGELIFSLPFHLPRYFRPSVLAGFGFTNGGLGDVFAAYGITAMLAYFPGGAIADRFPAHMLMTCALVATAAGGVYLATVPSHAGMTILYAYWGITTILPFWAPMVRTMRALGGAQAQGRAFGVLEAGRGLTAAGFATLAVWFFSREVDAAASSGGALGIVIRFYTVATVAAGVLVWYGIRRVEAGAACRRFERGRLRALLGTPLVWLQALVVVVAYCGYKGLDNYALFVHQVLGLDEVRAAGFGAASAYLRPVAAILAGLAADRLGGARLVGGLFAGLVVVYGALAVAAGRPALAGLVYGNLILSAVAVFALRGVYFALLEETRIPRSMTGTAVGVISLVGYTPDVFFAPLAGRILDASPGATGHAHYFLLLAVSAALGLAAAAGLGRLTARHRTGAAAVPVVD